jgi:chromosome segregation ATPase
MRDQDKDLELPSFGPAEREPAIKVSGEKPQTETPQKGGAKGNRADAEQKVSSGGGALSYLIILLLAVAVAGLAYWNFMQHQQLQVLENERKVVDEKIIELQKLFLVAGDSAAQTGESLQNQVKKQAEINQQKFASLEADSGKFGTAISRLDAEITKLNSENGKLWVVAHQRNTPKIAELEKQLNEASAQLDKQSKALEGMTGELTKLDKQLAASEAKGSENAKQVAAIRQSAAALSTQFQALSESIDLQQADQKKKMALLAEQVISLKESQGQGAGLERRVKVNEQAVKAIDGSRLVVNNELLQIRQKLNNLQLKVEQLQSR